MWDKISTIIPYLLSAIGGGAITSLITLPQIKKGAKLDNDTKSVSNEGLSIENLSKIIDEYQDYIQQLKADKKAAIEERDEYKKQVDELWKEVNELKKKLASVEGSLVAAQLRLSGLESEYKEIATEG